jgi:hypothetical protein
LLIMGSCWAKAVIVVIIRLNIKICFFIFSYLKII